MKMSRLPSSRSSLSKKTYPDALGSGSSEEIDKVGGYLFGPKNGCFFFKNFFRPLFVRFRSGKKCPPRSERLYCRNCKELAPQVAPFRLGALFEKILRALAPKRGPLPPIAVHRWKAPTPIYYLKLSPSRKTPVPPSYSTLKSPYNSHLFLLPLTTLTRLVLCTSEGSDQ
ncbi:hypothetical protein WA026_023682 [Henosepilachna vigintioctopunctata]|uniref:Uncharacterized protein n=1 Tax=Henosepilachna vigintioctopunctata TaxID=420089 RepID=A0AAW1TZ78_9CUCU